MLEIAVLLEFTVIVYIYWFQLLNNIEFLKHIQEQKEINNKVFEGLKLFDESLNNQQKINRVFSDKLNDVITTTNALNDDLTKLIKIMNEVNECTNTECD